MKTLQVRGPHSEKVLNRLIQGTSKVYFGPLPVRFDPEDTLNNTCIEYNIKGVNWPGINATFSTNKFMGMHINVPNSDVNDSSNHPVTIEVIADDTLDNYCLFRNWIDVYRSTEHRTEFNNTPGKYDYWDGQRAWCDHMDIIIANNTRETMAILRFEHVFCESIGDITMDFNSSAEISFTVSFKYNMVRLIRNPTDVETMLQSFN